MKPTTDELIKEFKWIKIIQVGLSSSKKTKIFQVFEKNDGLMIGIIKWKASWRKYAFFTEPETFFEEECLYDLSMFLKEIAKIKEVLK